MPNDTGKDTADTLVVRDRASRRRFIRAGAAFALAGGALATGRAALAADCDQSREGCAAACSDSDSGDGSDPTGGGRRCSNISISRSPVTVAKVRA